MSETPATVTPRRCDVAHAWLEAAAYRELKAEADRRRIHPDQLAALIIDAVLVNGYVDAVLQVAS